MTIAAQVTPQEVTETPAAATPPETAAADAVNWDEMGQGLGIDDDEGVVEGDVEVLDGPQTGDAAATGETLAAKSAEEPAPAATTPTYTPPAPVAPRQLTPEEVKAQEAKQLAELMETYKLSEEDSRAMLTEPEVVLPKLLAQMHLQATKSVLGSLQTVVPQIVDTTNKATAAETEARSAFFKVNSDLAKPEYEAAVLKIGAMYRQVNPNAPRDVAVKTIGEMARVALGLPALQAVAAVPAAQAPAAKPFSPARGGTGGVAPKAKGVWEQLAADFDNED